MKANFLTRLILCVLLLMNIGAEQVQATDEAYLQSIQGNQVHATATFTTEDEKFNGLTLSQWNLISDISVTDIITFEIMQKETSVYYYGQTFSCTLNFSIQYYKTRDQVSPDELNNLELTVSYNATEGTSFPLSSKYNFKDAYKIIVTVNSITSTELGTPLPDIFRVKSEILVKRKYPFSAEINGHFYKEISTDNYQNNTLLLVWTPAVFSGYDDGFATPDEYDIEWTYVDDLSQRGEDLAGMLSANSLTDDVLAGYMRNDNTRVTVTGQSYSTNFVYNSGYLLIRMRGAWYDPQKGIRLNSNWVYQLDDEDGYAVVNLQRSHQSQFNWQYTAAYAEEGKHKEIISYFDGALKSRQTVTVNNSDAIAIAAETVYDKMGRPTVNVLPAPVYSDKVQYYPLLNLNLSDAPFSHNDFGLPGEESCNIQIPEMSNAAGASRYYSPQNDFKDNPDYYFTKFVPDAFNKPFSATQYKNDNTGRLAAQSGVGPNLQILQPDALNAEAHYTRYFYGKPTQKQLDRMFGMEVGLASHYLRNMVIDPNGQASVSYIDANGKTIATALAGPKPETMDQLPNTDAEQVTTSFNEELITGADLQKDAAGLTTEATATFIATVTGDFSINYTVNPAALTTTYGLGGQSHICNNCYFEVAVMVKNECGEIVANDESEPFPMDDATCYENPEVFNHQFDFPVAQLGEYSVEYKLRLREDVIRSQTELYINTNTDLKTVQTFFHDEMLEADLRGCYSECSSCLQKLGSPENFAIQMHNLLSNLKEEKYENYGFFDINSAEIQGWISTQYSILLTHCTAISQSCISSPCDEKLERMKADVLPGGQYLRFNIDEETNEYSIAENEHSSILYVSNQLESNSLISDDSYKYDDRITDFEFTEDNGSLHHIKDADVTPDMFIKAYIQHPEWADDFVKRHIEYCSYLWCRDHASASYAFDDRLRDIIRDGEDAENQGLFSRSNYKLLLDNDLDPFFTSSEGSPYKAQMIVDLANLSRVVKIIPKDSNGDKLDLPNKNILKLIDWVLYCKSSAPDLTETEIIDSWTCNPDVDCRSITGEWELYRNYYLKLKGKYVQLAKQSAMPDCKNCFIGTEGLGEQFASCEDNEESIPTSCPNPSSFSGSYGGTSGTYTYPAQIIDASEAPVGSTISVMCYSYDIPNLIDIRDAGGSIVASTGWIGWTNHSGPWGTVLHSSASTSISFPKNEYDTYTIEVKTLIFADSSDAWQANISCSLAPAPPPAVASACSNDSRATFFNDKNKVFNEYINEEGYLNCLDASAAGILGSEDAYNKAKDDLLNKTLPALKQSWLEKLEAVRDEEFSGISGPAFGPLDNSVLINITDKLANICTYYINNYSSAANPSLKLVRSLSDDHDVVSVDGYNNFTDVFTDILGLTLVQQGFGAELLEQPYPFDKNPVPSATTIFRLDQAPGLIDNIGTLADQFSLTGGTTIEEFHAWLKDQLKDDYQLSLEELGDLFTRNSNGCNLLNKPIIVPAVFTTPNQFVSCETISELRTSFGNDYPNVTVDTKLYRLLLTNYLNLRLGYSLSYYEYKDYSDNCIISSNAILYNKPAIPQVPPTDDFGCVAGIVARIFENSAQAYEKYIDIVRREFRNNYIAKCLSNSGFLNVEAEQYEYHYTLYYYDQAGNLLKTIPPEGVRLLDGDQLDELQIAHNQQASGACSKIMPDYNNALDALTQFSVDISAGTVKGVEMWLYGANTPAGGQVRFVAPDKTFFYQTAIKGGKLWLELYLLDGDNANQGSEILYTNTASADISGLPALTDWTHLFVQFNTVVDNFEIYLNGTHLDHFALGSEPPYPFPWEMSSITGALRLPAQDISLMKHFRLYNTIVDEDKIIDNANSTCLAPMGELANYEGPLLLWANFNTPSFCNGTGTDLERSDALHVIDGSTGEANMLTTVSNSFTMEMWLNADQAQNISLEEEHNTDGFDSGVFDQHYPVLPALAYNITNNSQDAGVGIAAGPNGITVYERGDNYFAPLLVWSGALEGWNHIAVVYTNKTPELYVNGTLVATGMTSEKQNIYPSYNLGGTTGSGFPGGSIDDYRIWATSRTSQEINDNMNGIVNGLTSGLVGYWPINSTDGNAVIDISCYHNNVTLFPGTFDYSTNGMSIMGFNPEEDATPAQKLIVPNHYLPSFYSYNSQNQVVKQTSPDGGTSEFWYDRLARLSISQNEQQKLPTGLWDFSYSYTHYDELGRIDEVGQRINADYISEEQARDKDKLDAWMLATENASHNVVLNTDITLTAYDEQPDWVPTSLVGTQANLRKRVAATAYIDYAWGGQASSGERSSGSYYNYDMSGNVRELVQESADLLQAEQQTNSEIPSEGLKHIKYEYDLISGKVNKVFYQDGQWDQFYYQYSYDADNRLTTALSSRVNYSDINLWNVEASYRYYLHGPLARMELGNSQVQGVDYAYTLQGWLKGVNSKLLQPSRDMNGDGDNDRPDNPFAGFGRDAFSFTLGYHQNDYSSIETGTSSFSPSYTLSASTEPGANLFNGNISHATYALSKINLGNSAGYTYRYDQLNRLTAMRFNDINSESSTWDNGDLDKFKENVRYDANGNITNYFRNGSGADGASPSMDDLTYYYYYYDENGIRKEYNKELAFPSNVHHLTNQLAHIGDQGGNDYSTDIKTQNEGNYDYDKTGNLKTENVDGAEVHYDWTVYGKLRNVAKNGSPYLTYRYDVAGNRISKTFTDYVNEGVVKNTYYIRDAQGNVLATYEGNSNGGLIWSEQYLYGISRVGLSSPGLQYSASEYSEESDPIENGIVGKRTFELTNHLGNVLSTISDIKRGTNDGNGNNDYYLAEVLSQNDYYPFGMLMPGRSFGLISKYGFNGKENDNELKGEGNQQDYGLRSYDARLGRFISVDPLTMKFPELTPYQFGSNTPIQAIDLDGGEAKYVYGSFNASSHPKLKQSEWFVINGQTNWSTFSAASNYNTKTGNTGVYQFISERSNYYKWADEIASGRGVNWFGAARDVTSANMVGAAEGINLWLMGSNTEKFMIGANKFLFEQNVKNFGPWLMDGKNPITDGKNSYGNLSGAALDNQMVIIEQNKLQTYIESYQSAFIKKNGKEKWEGMVEEINDLFGNPAARMFTPAANKYAADQFKKKYGDDAKFDFMNKEHRIFQGQKMAEFLRSQNNKKEGKSAN